MCAPSNQTPTRKMCTLKGYIKTLVSGKKVYQRQNYLLGQLNVPTCTSTTNPARTPAISSSEPMYCYCHGPKESTMIPCDNPDCPVELFHLECLHLRTVPREMWFCLDCQKLTKFLKAKKKTRVIILHHNDNSSK